MLGPFHILLMHHDLLNEQSQQFRRQFRDARVPFCFGNEVVGTGNRRFQFFNCLLCGMETFNSMSNFEQAKARIHRAGQKENCHYIYLVCRGTVDRKVLYALRQKMNLAKMLVDDYRKGRNPFKN